MGVGGGGCVAFENRQFLPQQLITIIFFIISSSCNCKVEQGNLSAKYCVLRLQTKDLKQFDAVRSLFNKSTDLNVNFWKTARNINDVSDIMVPQESLPPIMQLLSYRNVTITVIINDVEKLIIDRQKIHNDKFSRRLKDESTTSKYDFHMYGSYTQMVDWMKSLAKQYSTFVQFISIGISHEGRPIVGLEIGGNNQSKRVFWIDGGIHAREWASPHTALYFIHRLTSKYGKDEKITEYVHSLTWVIVPCLNPDGYEYTRTSTNPNIRLWRKNRSPPICLRDQWDHKKCCFGVDLNRNFDFHFNESGSSDDPCSEIYQGVHAFSEPETKAVRDAILSNRYRNRIDGFITLHTYSQIWVHPYGHKKDTYPGDIRDLYDVGKKATNALRKLYGTKYVLGSGADTLYPASGGSEDWAKQHASIKYVYLLELRPDERNWDGFILDEEQLIPTATETWAGVGVVADELIARTKRKHTQRRAMNNERSTRTRFGNGSTGSCYDLRHACKRWVQENESLCRTIPIFMQEQCAYSCGHC